MATVAEDSDEEGPPKPPPGKLYPLLPPRLPPPVLDYGGLAVHDYEDSSSYSGDWVRGMRSGWGVFTTPDGVRYAGEWRTDRYDGLGVVRYASGNRYEGEFLASHRHGRGLFLWKTTVRARGGPWRQRGARQLRRPRLTCPSTRAPPRARCTTACGTTTCAWASAATCGLTAASMRASGRRACSMGGGVTSGQTVRQSSAPPARRLARTLRSGPLGAGTLRCAVASAVLWPAFFGLCSHTERGNSALVRFLTSRSQVRG